MGGQMEQQETSDRNNNLLHQLDLQTVRAPRSDAAHPFPEGPRAPLRLDADRFERITICTRPFRASGPRLEEERLEGKRVIHNYGHGGAGWSLSWGCAEDVLGVLGPVTEPVAVIGAGAIGLTTALRLSASGIPTTIYAEKFPSETGSAKATGSWSPDSRVALATDIPDCFASTWERWARRSYAVHQHFGDITGGTVEYLPRYTVGHHKVAASRDATRTYARLNSNLKDLTPLSDDIDPAAYGFSMPFARKEMRMTFNVAQYTQEIETAYRLRGGVFERRTFKDRREVTALSESVIINCTGFGAKALFGDETLIPVRGQIAWLEAQPDAQYGIDFGGASALSRRDGIAIQDRGETDDFGVDIHDETPDRAEFEAVLARLQQVTASRR